MAFMVFIAKSLGISSLSVPLDRVRASVLFSGRETEELVIALVWSVRPSKMRVVLLGPG
jgi:hypothetical protein